MQDFNGAIGYLTRGDFTVSGQLVPELRRRPVFIMIQSNGCGHCVRAKPAFQSLASEGIVQCMTIQADGSRHDERELVPMLDKICPGFRGFPSYVLSINGKNIPYEDGDRSLAALKRFVLSHI